MNQLKEDVTDLFSDSTLVTSFYPDYNGTDYAETLVKEAYENYPEISYPLITIEEISNTNTNKYWDGTEFATDLVYQFSINCEQTETKTANENARIMADILDKYMQGERYNCLRRRGFTPPRPSISDPNVKTCYLRYDCSLVASQNTIYRRY